MSSRDIYRLDQIVERSGLDLHSATYGKSGLGFMSDLSRVLERDGMQVRLEGDRMNDAITIGLRYVADDLNVDDARTLRDLLDSASSILTLYNEEMKAERTEREAARKQEQAEYRAEQERRREEARKAREQRDRLTEERTQRLLMEFVGDEVRLRHKGYKSLARAEVEAIETNIEDEPYRVRFAWVNADVDYSRPQNVRHIRRLDVRDGSRFYTVWDDGPDDLNPWDRSGVASSKPWQGQRL